MTKKVKSGKSFKDAVETMRSLEISAIKKSQRSIDQILITSFFAGMFVAFGGYLSLVVGNVPKIALENPGLQKLLAGGVFPVGLVLVVLTESDLLTGNMFTFIPALLKQKMKIRDFLKSSLVSLVGNFLGSVFVAGLLTYFIYRDESSTAVGYEWIAATEAMAKKKTSDDVLNLIASGIGCNILVGLAIFGAAASNQVIGKIFAIWIPITTFVALSLEHSVANMYFISAGMMFGADIDWWKFPIANLLPVIFGNFVGGSIVLGFFYYLVYDIREKHPHAVYNTIRTILVSFELATATDEELMRSGLNPIDDLEEGSNKKQMKKSQSTDVFNKEDNHVVIEMKDTEKLKAVDESTSIEQKHNKPDIHQRESSSASLLDREKDE